MNAVGRSEPRATAGAASRPPGTALMALYPRSWRQRYGDELEALLETGGLDMRDRIDLIRGAVDAHLHPGRPSMLPVVAAIGAGGLATAHAIALAAQPTPLAWPGYFIDALPLAILAVALLLPSVIGLWLRLGDSDGVFGRLGIVVALAGHGTWLVALVAAALQIEYGPLTALAATVAMAGSAMLGIALAGRGSAMLGALLVVAALAGVAPSALGWPRFAGAWSAIGFRLLLDARAQLEGPAGSRYA